MEDLLEAIADNVTAIVLALARKGKTVGDIVPATEMINKAVDRMCASSRNTAKNPEIQAEARKVLEDTSTELATASTTLVTAARSARDAKSAGDTAGVSEAQRKAMHESKELLQKVTLLLMLEDQININFLVQSGKRVTAVAERLSSVESMQQLVQVAPEANVHHQDFLRRVRLRADVTRDGSDDKTHLLDAIATLQRAGPAHTAAAQRMVNPGPGPEQAQARAEAERLREEIERVVDDIIRLARAIFARNARFIGEAFAFRAPTSNNEDRLVHCAADFLQASARVVPLGGEEAAVAAFVEAGEHEVRAARGVASECSDPLQRRMVELCASELEGLLPQVRAAAGEVRSRGGGAGGEEADPTKTAFLRMLTAVTQGCGEALRLAGVLTPEEAVAANGLLCTRRMAELSKALEAGDEERARAELAAIDRDVARYIALAEMRAEDATLDPAERAAAQRAIEQLRTLRPRIVAAAQKVLGSESARKREALDALLAVARELTATRDIISAYAVQGAALATITRVECDGLTDTVRNRTPANYQQVAIEHAKDAARALQQMQLVARAALGEEVAADGGDDSTCAECMITDPEHRRQVEEALAQSTPTVAALINATKVAIQRPGDKQAYAALEAASERTKQCADRLADLLKPTEAELAAARARAEERVRAEAEAEEAEAARKVAELKAQEAAQGTAPDAPRPGRVVLTVEGPHDEHILHAAQTVVDTLGEVEGSSAADTAEGAGAADSGCGDDTPQGRVYRASHEIADLMTELAALAALDDKEGMISTGRKIAASTNAITTHAQPIAAQCSDPVLKGDVINNAQSAQNYAVQLKILCAVKAASTEEDPDDSTVKDQLVTAANGLASSIVGTAKSCQSASIHIRTHNNNNNNDN